MLFFSCFSILFTKWMCVFMYISTIRQEGCVGNDTHTDRLTCLLVKSSPSVSLNARTQLFSNLHL